MSNRAGQTDWILGNDGHGSAQIIQIKLPDVGPVQHDLPLLRVIVPGQQAAQARLAEQLRERGQDRIGLPASVEFGEGPQG